MLTVSYHPLYTEALHPSARFPRARYQEVHSRLLPHARAGLLHIAQAEPIALDDLLRVHDADYVDAFVRGQLSDAQIRRIGFRPWTPEFIPRSLTIAGGSLQALRRVLGGGDAISGNLAGGTHHAFAGHGEGFCVFNDLAVCARVALEDYGVRRVMIVDLDVHHGNGTAAIFAHEPRVFTFSMHGERNYPTRKPPSDLDIGLPDGTGDAEYLAILHDALVTQLHAFQPELILYQAGVDALTCDALGRLALSGAGLAARDALVLDYAQYWSCPVVLFMGGGYGDPITESADAHARLFLEAARRMDAR